MNIHIISIKSNQNLPRLNNLIEGRNRRSPEDFAFTHIREQLFRVIWSYLPLVCRTYNMKSCQFHFKYFIDKSIGLDNRPIQILSNNKMEQLEHNLHKT